MNNRNGVLALAWCLTGHAGRAGLLALCLAVGLAMGVTAGCTTSPSGSSRPTLRGEDQSPAATLAYYQMLQRMNGAEIQRERMVLSALAPSPASQLRMAMVLGHPRGPGELTRAQGLLEGVLKSSDAAATALHPLARLLADQYAERQRLENQSERQAQQLKESQRKGAELQEKLDNLTEIERSLSRKAKPARPVGSGGAK